MNSLLSFLLSRHQNNSSALTYRHFLDKLNPVGRATAAMSSGSEVSDGGNMAQAIARHLEAEGQSARRAVQATLAVLDKKREFHKSRVPASAAVALQIQNEEAKVNLALDRTYQQEQPALAACIAARQAAEMEKNAFMEENGLGSRLPVKPPLFESENRNINIAIFLVTSVLVLTIELVVNVVLIGEDMSDRLFGSLMLSACALAPLWGVGIAVWPVCWRCIHHRKASLKTTGFVLLFIVAFSSLAWINLCTITRGLIYQAVSREQPLFSSGLQSSTMVQAVASDTALQDALRILDHTPLASLWIPQIHLGGFYSLSIWFLYLACLLIACAEGHVIWGSSYWDLWPRERHLKEARRVETAALKHCVSRLEAQVDLGDAALSELSADAHEAQCSYDDLTASMRDLVKEHNLAITCLPEYARKLWRLYSDKIVSHHLRVGKAPPSWTAAFPDGHAPSFSGCEIPEPEDETAELKTLCKAIDSAMNRGREAMLLAENAKLHALSHLSGHAISELTTRPPQTGSKFNDKVIHLSTTNHIERKQAA
jgi:hypothetical protein